MPIIQQVQVLPIQGILIVLVSMQQMTGRWDRFNLEALFHPLVSLSPIPLGVPLLRSRLPIPVNNGDSVQLPELTGSIFNTVRMPLVWQTARGKMWISLILPDQ